MRTTRSVLVGFGLVAVLGLSVGGCKRLIRGCDTQTLSGIEYCVPPDTNTNTRDGVLPGPEGLGGIPSGIEIRAVLTKQNAFYVDILSANYDRTLADETYVITKYDSGTGVVGHATPGGWELVYDAHPGDGTSTRGHKLHTSIGGRHITCTYLEQNCKDLAAAEAICRSIRPAEKD